MTFMIVFYTSDVKGIPNGILLSALSRTASEVVEALLTYLFLS